MRVSISPATMPEVRVAVSGVLVRGLILAMYLNSSPSSAIAQITRGMGNKAPSRLPQGRPGNTVYTNTHRHQRTCTQHASHRVHTYKNIEDTKTRQIMPCRNQMTCSKPILYTPKPNTTLEYSHGWHCGNIFFRRHNNNA